MVKKVKNVIVICDFAYIEGGASRVAHESAIALSKDYHVTLFAAVGPVSDELQASKVNVVCLGQKDILHDKNRLHAVLQGLWNKEAKEKLSKVLNHFSCEDTIVHVHTWTKGISSSIFDLLEEKGFQVALTTHDYFLVCPNGGLYNYPHHHICEIPPMSGTCIRTNCDARNYGHKLFRVCRQKIQNDHIRPRKNISYIFISDFASTQLLRRYPSIQKHYFLENPINFTNRFQVECDKNSLYLYVGRLTDDKGIRIFCEGVTKAHVPAAVIGKGVLYEELKEKYPNIEFAGWKEKKDMVPYLKQTRCFVFPSTYYEASPLTPLEMLACGIPCIVSDKNASKDIIEEGKNGFLYDGYQSEALKQVIERCQEDDLIKTMNTYIYQTFDTTKYSMDNHIRHLKEIYQSILNGGD